MIRGNNSLLKEFKDRLKEMQKDLHNHKQYISTLTKKKDTGFQESVKSCLEEQLSYITEI